ncbi:LpqB family beta-propeller domain-containing protein [Salinactinospora qingdaonensis]|uniref:Lipoprotein LpqB n=1 Tax=Salinactinospora qingdaonensis TaxID=702744 RepID=A0ABP7FYL2_9ACTN
MTRKRHLRLVTTASALCLFAPLTACATVPTGGPVVKGAGGDDGAGHGGTYVQLLAAGPQDGVGENGLIRGFLRDMGSFDEDYRAARSYMTPQRHDAWQPNGTVWVYEGLDSVVLETTTANDGQSANVRMRTRRVATIEATGQYMPASPEEFIDVTFELAKVEGEWRISELPDELLLSRRDIDRVYRPLNLYFFNRDRSSLVPDPIFLPVQPASDLPAQLSRTLSQMLVDGPTPWLSSAVRSAFPEDTRAEVEFDSGRVTVQLSNEAAATGSDGRVDMAAQLIWTLKQIPEIQELVLRIGDEEVLMPDTGADVLRAGSEVWNSVNPSGVNGDLHAYFMRDGQLWSLDDEQQEEPIPGALGQGALPLERHAIALAEDKVAGVTGQGKVVVSDISAGSTYATVLGQGEYSALSWDGYGNLWVVEDLSEDSEEEGEEPQSAADADDNTDRDASAQPSPDTAENTERSRVWLLRDGIDPVQVAAPHLESTRVTELRASRDGVRVAAITTEDEESRLLVGRVVHSEGTVAAQQFLPLATDLTGVFDLSWRGADQLAVLGSKEIDSVKAYLVSLDGSTESTSASATPGTDMKSIAAAPGEPMLSGVENDHVWLTNDRVTWQRMTDGTNPIYPG